MDNCNVSELEYLEQGKEEEEDSSPLTKEELDLETKERVKILIEALKNPKEHSDLIAFLILLSNCTVSKMLVSDKNFREEIKQNIGFATRTGMHIATCKEGCYNLLEIVVQPVPAIYNYNYRGKTWKRGGTFVLSVAEVFGLNVPKFPQPIQDDYDFFLYAEKNY